MPPEISELDKAYAAGYFDARGYVRIGCQKGRTPRLTVLIRVHPEGLPWFNERWEGAKAQEVRATWLYNQQTRTFKHGEGQRCWSLQRIPAQRFLRDIQPYLHSRGEFVHLCLEFLHRVIDKNEKTNASLQALVNRIREAGKLSW